MKLASLVEYLDGYLRIAGHPDYPTALNGLQVEGAAEVERIAAAVDASEAAVDAALDREAQLLIVHHGLFWDGLRPVTGRRRRKLAKLIEGDLSVFSVHLPLDAHVEVGNCILLARALGVEPSGRFGTYQGTDIGWWGALDLGRAELAKRAEKVLGGDVRLLASGPERVSRVGVLTGSGAFVEEAARLGIDTVVTGEGAHHIAIDAAELGVNVLYGGHYATETFGVRALAAHLGDRFGLKHDFLELPTGT
jgi:dinuclear metal center YbgI/SA1388 family protein